MSGGDGEHFALRQTNGTLKDSRSEENFNTSANQYGSTVSTPHIEFARSQNSIVAAEDYHSAHSSRAASPESDDEVQEPTKRYSTPPSSPPRTPNTAQRVAAGASNPVTAAPTEQRDDSSAPEAIPRQPNTGETGNRIKRKPVSSASSGALPQATIPQTGARMGLDDRSSVTSDVDDTQYIHFAIDQLTRDEEVRGSRMYPGAVAVGPRQSIQTRQVDNRAPPVELPSQAPERAFLAPPEIAQPAPAYEFPAPPTTLPVAPPTGPVTGRRQRPVEDISPAARAAREVDDQFSPVSPFPQATPSQPQKQQQPQNDPPISQQDVFVPYDTPVPPLRAKPGILKPLWLGLYLFVLILVLAGLLFSGIYSATHLGLWGYGTFHDGRYFVFEYLPVMIGMFLLLWLFQIQVAVQRVTPFIAMASMSSKGRSEGPLLEMQPTQFLFPQLSYFRAGFPVIGGCMFVFWLQIFTIPLFASLYGVFFYGDAQTGTWRWETVQGVVWTLFALFVLQVLAISVLLIWMSRRWTGLHSDVRSIADLIALIEQSNVSSGYANSEKFPTRKVFREQFSNRSDRLGLWHSSLRPNEPFYGLGEEGVATRRYSVENGRVREKPAAEQEVAPGTPQNVANEPFNGNIHDLESGENYDRIRFNYLPWYLRTPWILAFTVLAIALYVAFLVVSFVNDAVLDGYSPLTPTRPTQDGFSSTNFLYSFIPAVIAELLFILWLSIDYAFRRLEPYANMTPPLRRQMVEEDVRFHGAPAQRSLLLDFPARAPILVTLSALYQRCWRVAWFSTISLIAATLPILGGGAFWAQEYRSDNQVRVAVDPAAYYVLCVFLGLYAFSLPLTLIKLRRRRLPHGITTVSEQLSFLYASHLLGEQSRRASPGSRPQLVARLVAPMTSRERNYLSGTGDGNGRFFFGRFVGRDGRTHIGIERIGRNDTRALTSHRAFRGQETSSTTRLGYRDTFTSRGRRFQRVNPIRAANEEAAAPLRPGTGSQTVPVSDAPTPMVSNAQQNGAQLANNDDVWHRDWATNPRGEVRHTCGLYENSHDNTPDHYSDAEEEAIPRAL